MLAKLGFMVCAEHLEMTHKGPTEARGDGGQGLTPGQRTLNSDQCLASSGLFALCGAISKSLNV